MKEYAVKMRNKGLSEKAAMIETANKFKIILLDERQIPINTP
jgi:hypothetical protein